MTMMTGGDSGKTAIVIRCQKYDDDSDLYTTTTSSLLPLSTSLPHHHTCPFHWRRYLGAFSRRSAKSDVIAASADADAGPDQVGHVPTAIGGSDRQNENTLSLPLRTLIFGCILSIDTEGI